MALEVRGEVEGDESFVDRPFGSAVPVGPHNDAPSYRGGLSPSSASKSRPVLKEIL
jgi:hypothetical protein